jgi:plastocyanin
MKKLAALLLVLILASVGLVACGGDSDTTATEAAPKTSEETTEETTEGGGASAAVEIEADPEGNLAYTTKEATATAGKVTIDFNNSSPVPHDVAIEDSGGKTITQTETLAEGSDSATANLKPGTYTFYCSVPGHREAGMEGTLTVK